MKARTVLEKASFGSFNSDCSICVYRKKKAMPILRGRDCMHIYLVTGEEWLVTGSGNFGCFSADGTEIVYTARIGGIQQLYRVPLNGGTSEQITNFDENDTCWNISNPPVLS